MYNNKLIAMQFLRLLWIGKMSRRIVPILRGWKCRRRWLWMSNFAVGWSSSGVRMRTTIRPGTPGVCIVLPGNVSTKSGQCSPDQWRLISWSWPSSPRTTSFIVPGKVLPAIGGMFPGSERPILRSCAR